MHGLSRLCAAQRAVAERARSEWLLWGAASSFYSFSAVDSSAVRVAASARAGFKTVNWNINTAETHGSAVGMHSGGARDLPAAVGFQSCIFSRNIDPLGQGYPVSQSDHRSLHYNDRIWQKSLDVSTGALLSPEPIDGNALNQLGFLAAGDRSSSYQEIARVRSARMQCMRTRHPCRSARAWYAPCVWLSRGAWVRSAGAE
jgi:hypothetical protein